MTVTENALSLEQADDVVAVLGAAERVGERARGIGNVIAERRRSVALALAQSAQTDVVASLESEAARIEGELGEAAVLAGNLEPERDALELEAEQLAAAEAAWLGKESRTTTATPAEASSEAARLRRGRDGVRDELAAAREALAGASERETSLVQHVAELETAVAQAALDAERYQAAVDEAGASSSTRRTASATRRPSS